jgi:hypothetical protein
MDHRRIRNNLSAPLLEEYQRQQLEFEARKREQQEFEHRQREHRRWRKERGFPDLPEPPSRPLEAASTAPAPMEGVPVAPVPQPPKRRGRKQGSPRIPDEVVRDRYPSRYATLCRRYERPPTPTEMAENGCGFSRQTLERFLARNPDLDAKYPLTRRPRKP